MKKIISGIGFFLSALVIGNGIVSYCEVSGLKERIQDLETESDWIGKQVSAAPFNQNKKYVFESYDEKSGSVKQQVYRIHSYGENQIVLQKEEPDNQEIFLIKVKDDYLAVYKKADMHFIVFWRIILLKSYFTKEKKCSKIKKHETKPEILSF